MKKSFLFIAAATAILFTTSCQKEETVQSFTAQLENSNSDAKTVLAGFHINWQYNVDEVEIYDADNNHATFVAQQYSSGNTDATKAKLVNTSNNLSNTSSSYKAIYPASIARSSNTIALPRVQTSSDGSLTGYPMYAESASNASKSLQFYNLCSVLKLNLQKANQSVSKIQIVTDKLTTGTFTIDYNDGSPTLTASNTTDHTAVTTLQLSSPVSITSAHDFYIYLPAFSYDYMQIKVYNANGLLFFETWQKPTNGTPMTLTRSQYHPLSFGENDLDFQKGNVNGLFHIGPSTVVTFAKGNLLQSNSNSTYKFAEEQYNYSESGYTFRFNWGNQNGQFNERGNTNGTNNITNATGIWRTMSANEWRYVCNNVRSNSTSEEGTRGDFVTYHTRAHLKVTKSGGSTIGGMILFPDKFHWPLDASKQPPSNSFDGGSINTAWNGVTISYDDWKILEDAGCVFLPMTGGYLPAGYSNAQNTTYGCYWTSSYLYADNESARCIYIHPTGCNWPQNTFVSRRSTMSHRLVRVVTQQ